MKRTSIFERIPAFLVIGGVIFFVGYATSHARAVTPELRNHGRPRLTVVDAVRPTRPLSAAWRAEELRLKLDAEKASGDPGLRSQRLLSLHGFQVDVHAWT